MCLADPCNDVYVGDEDALYGECGGTCGMLETFDENGDPDEPEYDYGDYGDPDSTEAVPRPPPGDEDRGPDIPSFAQAAGSQPGGPPEPAAAQAFRAADCPGRARSRGQICFRRRFRGRRRVVRRCMGRLRCRWRRRRIIGFGVQWVGACVGGSGRVTHNCAPPASSAQLTLHRPPWWRCTQCDAPTPFGLLCAVYQSSWQEPQVPLQAFERGGLSAGACACSHSSVIPCVQLAAANVHSDSTQCVSRTPLWTALSADAVQAEKRMWHRPVVGRTPWNKVGRMPKVELVALL